MEIVYLDVNNLNIQENKSLNLCLGYFDGIHLGHKDVINRALEKGLTGVMTFDIPPCFALGKRMINCCLTSIIDKANLLESIGVQYLYILKMSQTLLNLSHEEFVELILKKINPAHLYCGQDYRFGKNAMGDPTYLGNFFPVTVVPLKLENNIKIATSSIIPFVQNGEIKEANILLGRNYKISGIIVEGKKNGSKIGFPTANMKLNYPYVLPKIGVYSGFGFVDDKCYPAVISVSTHPTIDELDFPIVEVHLIGFDDCIYGKPFSVEFIERIRNINKFKNLDELKKQIAKDINFVKSTLK